ncbi:MAG: hypothetical protein RLY82_974 [Pseudomonadota bacterium]|jgi:membrane-associated phospholipid phosphatase
MNQVVFLWLNSHLTSFMPDWFWAVLSISGHAGMLGAFFSWFLFTKPVLLTALFITAVSGGSVGLWLKTLFAVPRPAAVLSSDEFHLIGYKLETISFPSGHSLTSFAGAIILVLGLELKGWRMLAVFGLATLIALSRIAVGAHWPIDILAGGAIGLIFGFISFKIAKWAHKKYIFLESNTFLWLQALAILISSTSLFMTRMGYRIALPWQAVVGLMGVVVPLFFIYKRLIPLTSRR